MAKKKYTRAEFLKLTATAAASGPFLGQAMAGQAAMTTETGIKDTSNKDLLVRGADVLTMDPELGELYNTDVLVRDGLVAAIGKNLSASGVEVVDGKGMILMPGMIDGHRHMWEYIGLGQLVKFNPTVYSEGYMLWNMASVVAMEPEDHYISALVGGLVAINSGVTTVLDYAHGQDTGDKAVASAKGLQDSGIGGWFGFQLGRTYPFGLNQTVSKKELLGKLGTYHTKEEHWDIATRLQKEVFSNEDAQLQLALAPASHIGYPLSEIQEEWTRLRATNVGLLIQHMHKPATPFPEGYMGHRDSGIPDLYDADLLGPDYHVSHANRLTPEELAMMKETGGMICATTMGEFPYMMDVNEGPPVLGRAREAGVPVGIGVDVVLALTSDYFEHMRSSFWSHYLEAESRNIVKDYHSRDTLDFATALGAKAVRLGDKVGTLTVGKRADMLLISTDRVDFGAAGSLADRVVTFANTADIDSVWIAGKARKRDGQMLGVDWSDLKRKLVDAQNRVIRRTDTIKWV